MNHWLISAIAGLASLSACADPGTPDAAPRSSVDAPAARASPARPPMAASAVTPLPRVLVHKDPNCGCCTAWAEHMRRHGFEVEVSETADLEPIRKRLGVPLGKGSCHTAEVGGLVVEGHVPAEDVKRLLALGDGSRGLVLPGMPLGSPGMEMPDGRVQAFTVERVDAHGATHPFAKHP